MGRAGTGYVNDYSGNLVFTTPIMSTTGERVPLDFFITYNNFRSGTHFKDGLKGDIYGWGWQSNLSQRVDPVSETAGTNDIEKAKFKLLAQNGYRFVYLDEDGTEHYFKVDPNNSARIIDEDGLGLVITSGGAGNEYYTIQYTDGSKKAFTSSGYLYRIYDSEENYLTLAYYGSFMNQITDGAGRITHVEYSPSGAVTKVTGPDGKETKLNYTGGNLSSINHPDGKTIGFSYDSSNQLQKITNVDGTYMLYSYYDSSDPMVKNRVNEAAEYSAAGDIGNKVTFAYNADNTTTFKYYKAGQTDAQAQKETYTFDRLGRTTSIVKMDGSAATYEYKDESVKTAEANKITAQAATSVPVNNLLLDHNAEKEDGTWTGSNWGSPGGVFSVDDTVSYLGKKSLRITQSQENPQRSGAVQSLTNLTPGTVYTLSAYVKTDQVRKTTDQSKGAGIYVACFNGSTSLGVYDGEGFFGSYDWQRTSLTFTVFENTTRVEVYGGLLYSNGTAWFDCFQLEVGSIANIYNLLENGEFRLTEDNLPVSWVPMNFTSGDGMVAGNVRIGGDPTRDKGFYQEIDINKEANSIAFIVSAKSTGSSVPTGRDGRFYAIDVGLFFTDGSSQYVVVPFNPDTNGEQFTSGPIAASQENSNKTIARASFYIIYYKNANEATFKFLQMNMDETGTTFAYNSNGKLITSKQNAKNTKIYTYTDAQELRTASIKNSAANFDQGYIYFYDSDDSNSSTKNPHRLVSARSAETGIGFYYLYDSYGNPTNTSMGSIGEEGYVYYDFPYLETLQNYSPDGNYLTSVSDQRDKTTTYNVDSVTGLTNSVTDPKGNTTYYSYNTSNNLLTGVSAQSSAGTVEAAYEYDAADRLSQITHNGFAYTFQRDGYGNTTAINVGTQNLITNTFAPGNGNLQSSDYGNGFRLGYDYDSYDRVIRLWKNNTITYQYLYDARGNLAQITEYNNGAYRLTKYFYDIGDRMIKKSNPDGSEIRYTYDNMNRPIKYVYNFANQPRTATADYGVDYRKHNTYLLSRGEVTHAYDNLNREFHTDLNPTPLQDPTFRAERSFVNVLDAKTTTLVDTYYNYRRIGDNNSTLSQYHYIYDDNGNISSTTDIDGNVTTYVYDQLNQLVRADDQKAGVSTVYTYDVGGNITQVTTYAYTTGTLGTETDSVVYSYGNTNWKDLLTGYDGQSITYDAIGNPLTYRDGMSFTWEGRQLKITIVSSQNLEYTVEYTYDSNGIRTGKLVNGTKTTYFLDGSTIIAQQTDSDVLWFLYDSDRTLVGFTYNDTAYYYTKNVQGDVTGIVDSNVNLVAEYTYDAWGKPLSTTYENGYEEVAQANPFRYRGYYYDSETGLYCLSSRYYDPQTGRFLNADAQIGANQDIRDYNLFVYCGNNPVNRSDVGGLFWKEIGNWISNTASTISSWVGSTATKVSNWVGTTASSIKTWVASSVTGALVGNAVVSGIDTAAEKAAAAVKTTESYWKPSTLVNARNTHVRVTVPKSSAPAIKAAQKISKAGVLSLGLLAGDIYSDAQSYSGGNLEAAIGIDTGAFVTSFLIGAAIGTAALPELVVFGLTLGVGYLIAQGSEKIKEEYLN
ncbi:RHS repeat-associated core domain-containing protein [Caproicibacter sp.]|uniref:RHS repeat domain-containing protein n=1 Tax=Caproicibacter sp. TaxID=2814884 RepID=UPI003989564D